MNFANIEVLKNKVKKWVKEREKKKINGTYKISM